MVKRARVDYSNLKSPASRSSRKKNVMFVMAPQAVALKTLALYVQKHKCLEIGVGMLERHHQRGELGKAAVSAAVNAANTVCERLGPENSQDTTKLVRSLDKLYVDAVSSCLEKVVSTRVMYKLLQHSSYQSVKKKVQQEGLNKLLAELTPDKVLRICDLARVSTEGWTTVWKALKDAATGLGVKLRTRNGAANPYCVDIAKKRLDTEAQLTMLKGSQCTEEAVHLDFYNVLQVAVASSFDRGILSRSATRQDGRLKVCICLDETKWFADKKLERVCLKLMNEVMRDEDDRLADTRFQSEDDVFPLSLFYVAKEDYVALSQGLQHIKNIVQELEDGKVVHIPGVESEDGSPYDFLVECHLAADLKTLHLMYQVSNSPSAKLQNLYDMDLKQDRNNLEKRPGVTRELHAGAVLPIPLDRVHFCSMHAEMRLVDFLVNKLIGIAWTWVQASDTSKSKEEGQKRVQGLQDVLQAAGVYGGHVQILADNSRKRKSDGAVQHCRLSFNDRTCRKILEDKVYEGMVKALQLDRGHRVALLKMWEAVANVCKYLRGWDSGRDKVEIFNKDVEIMMHAYVACFPDQPCNKYMHMLYCQGSFFLVTYGAFGIWNAQALEKSHYKVKYLYLTKSNKGGGQKERVVCPLWQLCLIQYRQLAHRVTIARLRLSLSEAYGEGRALDDVVKYHKDLHMHEQELLQANMIRAAIEGQYEEAEGEEQVVVSNVTPDGEAWHGDEGGASDGEGWADMCD